MSRSLCTVSKEHGILFKACSRAYSPIQRCKIQTKPDNLVFSQCERMNECDRNAICSNTYDGFKCQCKVSRFHSIVTAVLGDLVSKSRLLNCKIVEKPIGKGIFSFAFFYVILLLENSRYLSWRIYEFEGFLSKRDIWVSQKSSKKSVLLSPYYCYY